MRLLDPAFTTSIGTSPPCQIGPPHRRITVDDPSTNRESLMTAIDALDLPTAPEEDRSHQLDAYFRAANYLTVGQIYLHRQSVAARAAARRAHQTRGCSATGGRAPGSISSTPTSTASSTAGTRCPLRLRPGSRRAGHGGQCVAGGDLQRAVLPRRRERPGHGPAVPPVLLPRGHPESRRPETPGSINEGGELGYGLDHAFGAAFDNPDLVVACVVGDGEAETGPAATGWHSNKFLDPAATGRCCPSSI